MEHVLKVYAISENFQQINARMGLEFNFNFQAASNQSSIGMLPPVPQEQSPQRGLVTCTRRSERVSERAFEPFFSFHFPAETESMPGSERDDDQDSGNEDKERNSERGAVESEPEYEFEEGDTQDFPLFVVHSR